MVVFLLKVDVFVKVSLIKLNRMVPLPVRYSVWYFYNPDLITVGRLTIVARISSGGSKSMSTLASKYYVGLTVICFGE